MNAYVSEVLRFGINGVVATAVHFGVLSFNLSVLNLPSAGLANLIAAIAGIATSFLGSRYFVYRKRDETLLTQATRFSGLYGCIAVLHGFTLMIWTDWLELDYKIGFVIVTAAQVCLSYIGNKLLVFRV